VDGQPAASQGSRRRSNPFRQLTASQTLVNIPLDLRPPFQTGWSGEEKRKYPRFPLAVELGLVRLPLLESTEAPHVCLGTTENVSTGGMAVLSNQPLPLDALVRCEVCIPGTSVSIPTLGKVQWSEELQAPTQYRLGLQFLV
jgi:hypothetical protein